MAKERKLIPESNESEKTFLDLKEAKENLNTLEGLLKMRQKKLHPKNQDGTKDNEDFDIDPIPGYGGAW